MPQIFLSYARETHDLVATIAEALLLEGYDVWWDEELPVHRSYSDVIHEQIGASKAVMVAWSRAAADSEWVRAEADRGREQHKLVQVLVSEVTLPMPFSQIQYADLRDWGADRSRPEWQKVLRSLNELVERPAPAGAEAVLAIQNRFRGMRHGSGPFSIPLALALGFALLLVLGAGYWFWRQEGVMREIVQQLRTAPSSAARTIQQAAPAPAAVPVRAPAPTRARPHARSRQPARAPSSSSAAPTVVEASTPLPRPSFDCTGTSSDIERYICSDPDIAGAERTMAVAYLDALGRTTDKQSLRASQHAFLLRVLATPRDRTALILLYRARVEELNAVRTPSASSAPAATP